MPSYRRAVVLLKGFLGDAVMATPLLEGLRGQFSTVVVAPPAIGSLLGESWRDSFFPVLGRGLLPRVSALRKAHADIAFVLNRSFRSALSVRVAGIGVRVGHAAERRGFLLTHQVQFDERRHETESALDLARAVGIELAPMQPMLRLTDGELARGRELLGGADFALQPGARHEYKRLPPETLAELVPMLLDAGLTPVLVGGSEEVEAAAALQSAFPKLRNLVGECSLRETMGLLAASRLTLGADTGILHIAAAVGCPTVTVFGPTEHATRWGHLYAPHQVLQAGPEGMGSVSAQSIFEAAKLATERGPREPSTARST
ncbi:MAG TPA: glycosyltransferase family 9 protein [Fimbriimonadaceae bacterium]|nr:glycosyltransferase family 9 protein [Fimbriimonadaceae bacterium]